MMSIKTAAMIFMLGTTIHPIFSVYGAEAIPVSVQAFAEHKDGKIFYHYQVSNSSDHEITTVMIGHNPGAPIPTELTEDPEAPASGGSKGEIVANSATSPYGWRAYVMTTEDGDPPAHSVVWGVKDDKSPRLLPHTILKNLSVGVDKHDPAFLSGHAFIIGYPPSGYPVSTPILNLTISIESLDTTPPQLSVSVSPASLWPPNNKMVHITATLTVKDDYDGEPEIKLESITANELLEEGDIADAQFGSDDRQFLVRASRAGNNKDGRIYTVTYSATDATGNKASATATVTVPHDQAQ